MCVIIHKPAGVGFLEESLRCAYANNSDGFGYMYYHPEENRIIAKKSAKTTPDEIVKIVESLKDFEVVFHYRFKTVGSVIDSQCHPFRVLNKATHGVDMYFMHNGTIQNKELRLEGESDTQAFNRTVLKPFLSKTPSLVKTEAFEHVMQNYMGAGSKLVFMYGNGKIVKINEEAGAEFNGCWVSNTYSFQNGYRTPTTTRTAVATNIYTGGTNRTPFVGSTVTPNKNTDNKDTVEFLGVDVKVGDKIWLYSQENFEFCAEGIITGKTTAILNVTFTPPGEKEEVEVRVWLDDGQSYGHYTGKDKLYGIPAFDFDQTSYSKTVEQTKKENNQQGNVLMLPQKKDNNNEEDSLTLPVTYQNKTVDAKLRWGGGFLESAEECDYENTSIKDFYDMSAQKRFEWFMDNTEAAFNMLQDLAENLVIQDEEFMEDMGYFNEEEDADYYEDFENYQNAERMLS